LSTSNCSSQRYCAVATGRTCTCPGCEAEAAAQQFELEDHLEAELAQEVENALRQPRAKCPWCNAVMSANDRNELKREEDTTGATIKDI
jgi:hypothetical protein